MTLSIPGIAIAIAQTAIDYSKQPPRDLQLEAGTSLAIAGFIITFVVLGIFTVLIKTTSIIAERLEKRPTPPKALPTPKPAAEVSKEHIAVAVAVAHLLFSQKKKKPTTPTRIEPAPGPDPWVMADRLNPPTLLERGPTLEDFETRKWRRG